MRLVLKTVVFGIVLFGGMFACCLGFIANVPETHQSAATTVAPPQPTVRTPGIGDTGILTVSSGSIPVARTEAAWGELKSLLSANDSLGIAEMALQGKAFVAQPGTKVLVIDRMMYARRVRIQEGQFIGESGWVHSDWVAPIKP